MDFPRLTGYDIERQLGKGGMAIVYLAHQEKFERRVAIKVLASHLQVDAGFGERFLHEAQVVAQLNHPHIIPVYDVGRQDGCHYIAMEYLPGGDLRQRLGEGVEVEEAIYVVKTIAGALDYAASKHCVHRDIKPENILFREDGSPVLSDFGIAWKKDFDPVSTQSLAGIVAGSPSYMSPEQSKGGDIDGRSDLYSLGVVFYEMLVGRVPFQGDSAVAIELQRLSAPAPELPPEVAAFQDFMDRALALDPQQRFQTGHDLADALESLERELGLSARAGRRGAQRRRDAAAGAPSLRSGSMPSSAPAPLPLDGVDLRARREARERAEHRRTRALLALAAVTAAAVAAYIWLDYRQLGPFSGLRVEAPGTAAPGQSDDEASRFIDLARAALDGGKLEVADRHLIAAQQLAPGDPRVVRLRSRLLEAQSFRARDRARDQFIAQQLAQAQARLESDDPLGAMRSLRSVLALEPGNGPAQESLKALQQQLFSAAEGAIAGGAFDQARRSIELLERADADADRVDALKASLEQSLVAARAAEQARAAEAAEQARAAEAAEQARAAEAARVAAERARASEAAEQARAAEAARVAQAAEQDRAAAEKARAAEEARAAEAATTAAAARAAQAAAAAPRAARPPADAKILQQAAALEQRQRTVAVNGELRALYLRALELAPDSAAAAAGLWATSDFELLLGRGTLERRAYAQTDEHLAAVRQATPEHPELEPLQNRLRDAQRAAERASQLLTEASAKIAARFTPSRSRRSNDAARAQLRSAYVDIEAARQVDAGHPGIPSAQRALLTRYDAIVMALIDADRLKFAGEFVEDVSVMDLPGGSADLQRRYADAASARGRKPSVRPGSF